MKKVLIFGKDGQLGFDLARVFGSSYEVKALNRQDVDITDTLEVSNIIEKERPDSILNATAYNNVEAAETDEQLAIAINSEAVGNMAKAVKLVDAIFVHISTDYVFDGRKDCFTEDDIPNPLNAYGRSKLKGEEFIRTISQKYYLIRTSSVFGSNERKQKKNFVDSVIERARDRQTLRVVNDQIMCPTYSYDLAVKINELIEKQTPFGIYHVTNQGSCSWFEFTKKILELMNISATVEPIPTQLSDTRVNRPKRTVLKNMALEKIGLSPMPAWEDALKRYLEEKYGK